MRETDAEERRPGLPKLDAGSLHAPLTLVGQRRGSSRRGSTAPRAQSPQHSARGKGGGLGPRATHEGKRRKSSARGASTTPAIDAVQAEIRSRLSLLGRVPSTPQSRRKRALELWAKVRNVFTMHGFREEDVDQVRGRPRGSFINMAPSLSEKRVRKPSMQRAREIAYVNGTRSSSTMPDLAIEEWDEFGESLDEELAGFIGEQDETRRDSLRQYRNAEDTLGVVQSCKVLWGCSTRLQVTFSRVLRRIRYSNPDVEVCRAGDSPPGGHRMMIVASGVAEAVLTHSDGSEVFVGYFGQGSLLEGLSAVGLMSSHLMTVRPARPRDGQPPPRPRRRFNEEESETDLVLYECHESQIKELEGQHREELKVLRRRVITDARRIIMPCLLETIYAGDFFRRYSYELVKRIATDLELRIFQPGDLIFKEKNRASNMAILFSGEVDVVINGTPTASINRCGHFLGESALLENSPPRLATVRCGRRSNSLIFLLTQQNFYAAIDEFPKEKARLEEQVKLKLIIQALGQLFKEVDRMCLHMLSTACEVLHVTFGQAACSMDEGQEALHLVMQGTASVEHKDVSRRRTIRAPEHVGFEAAMGYTSGPPDYSLIAGKDGCVVVRASAEAVRRAVHFFPDQLPAIMAAGGVSPLPQGHQLAALEGQVWQLVHQLMCQVLGREDVPLEHIRQIEPFVRKEVYDTGVEITAIGAQSREMSLLLEGKVTCESRGSLKTSYDQPHYFDAGIFMGIDRRQRTTVTASGPCLVWHIRVLPEASQQEADGLAALRRVVQWAAEQREELKGGLRARLRNMKTFRRFSSEILALISESLDLHTFLPGQDIFRKGDVGEHMFVIMKGKAQAMSDSNPVLEEGTTLGEMVLFGRGRRTVTVRAATLCICNAIHRDILSLAMLQNPSAASALVFSGRPISRERLKATEERRPRATELRHLNNRLRQLHMESSMASKDQEGRVMGSQHERPRSVLHCGPLPRVPPAPQELYRCPPEATERLAEAFGKILPPGAAAAAANMHGVAGLARCAQGVPPEELSELLSSRDDISRQLGRRGRVWPTYTSPLPPMSQRKVSLRREAARPRPRGAELEIALAGQLEVLNFNLLRVGCKGGLPASASGSRAQTAPAATDAQLREEESLETFCVGQGEGEGVEAYEFLAEEDEDENMLTPPLELQAVPENEREDDWESDDVGMDGVVSQALTDSRHLSSIDVRLPSLETASGSASTASLSSNRSSRHNFHLGLGPGLPGEEVERRPEVRLLTARGTVLLSATPPPPCTPGALSARATPHEREAYLLRKTPTPPPAATPPPVSGRPIGFVLPPLARAEEARKAEEAQKAREARAPPEEAAGKAEYEADEEVDDDEDEEDAEGARMREEVARRVAEEARATERAKEVRWNCAEESRRAQEDLSEHRLQEARWAEERRRSLEESRLAEELRNSPEAQKRLAEARARLNDAFAAARESHGADCGGRISPLRAVLADAELAGLPSRELAEASALLADLVAREFSSAAP